MDLGFLMGVLVMVGRDVDVKGFVWGSSVHFEGVWEGERGGIEWETS